MPLNVESFDKSHLATALDLRSPAGHYLADYLSALQATAFIREQYIDRHYIDDYARYYSRSFTPPQSKCVRVHFFADAQPADLAEAFSNAFGTEDHRTQSESYFQKHYLGFAVLRPLQQARLGRTVLKTYPADGRRHYEVIRPYVVNLFGLRLTINGLAYQEQDGGAAVCASTSLWVALQRVAHAVGHRSPTPSEVTDAAGSPYPASSGLEETQMAQALSKLGYIADKFVPAENRALFRSLLVAALDSQLPVVLLAERKLQTGAGELDIGHAVTVTGYSEPPQVVDVPPKSPENDPLRMKAASVEVLYVHDDNLGFHVHYELHDAQPDPGDQGPPRLCLYRGRKSGPTTSWWSPDEWTVVGALVPKPPKLRLPIDTLLLSLYEIRHLLTKSVFPGLQLHYAAKFSTGVAIKRELGLNSCFHEQHVAEFNADVDLPRHVGVLGVFLDDSHLCDVLLDVTQVTPSLLAIVGTGVPINSKAGYALTQICHHLSWRLLLALPDEQELEPS